MMTRSLSTLSSLVVAAVALWGLSGCQAETPDAVYFDAGARTDVMPPLPDAPARCPDTPSLTAPVIDNQPLVTAQLRQPLRGRAPGAHMLIAKGAMGLSSPVQVGDNGSFCIEVDLMPDAPNQITLTPYDINGCEGIPIRTNLTHKSAPKQTNTGQTGVHNVAHGQPISASTNAKTGSVSLLNDGDPKSWAQFEMFDPELGKDCSNRHVWIRVDLGKVYTVSKAKLRWGPLAASDKYYASCFVVLLSTKHSPVDPDPRHQDWVVAYQATDAGAEDQSISFNPQAARWAAVLLSENATTDWMQYEKFAVGEIEIHGQDPNVVPTPPADTCQ